jgi:hypothetical protein
LAKFAKCFGPDGFKLLKSGKGKMAGFRTVVVSGHYPAPEVLRGICGLSSNEQLA